jgi:hypothetical protein
VRTDREGLEVPQRLPKEYIEGLRLKVPEGLSKLMIDVIAVLLGRLKVPWEGIAEVTDILVGSQQRKCGCVNGGSGGSGTFGP